MSSNFNNAMSVPYGAKGLDKVSALTIDYLRSGKTLDWVVKFVGGSDNKQILKVLKAAQAGRFLTRDGLLTELKRYKIDENGRRVK